MALSEYRLSTLRFVYTSKLRRELQYTMQNLRKSLEWSPEPWPLPQRLPRRSFRVTYMKGPFKGKIAQRHYVFNDWQYQFTFREVEDVRAAVSTVLGSMTSETSCVCHFSWHFPGGRLSSPEELEALPEDVRERLREEDLLRRQDIERGLAAVRRKKNDETERQKSWFGHTLHYNAGMGRSVN
mmetsp:Transcript_88329/g.247088  ORF Transcript_88329/g.247088 Transcript_88329/m.247088 type:complete len:183 (-) Transcript_88329:18-566(-)